MKFPVHGSKNVAKTAVQTDKKTCTDIQFEGLKSPGKMFQ